MKFETRLKRISRSLDNNNKHIEKWALFYFIGLMFVMHYRQDGGSIFLSIFILLAIMFCLYFIDKKTSVKFE